LIVGAVAMVAAACQLPLVNAPAGGGAVVQNTYRMGPFNLGPGQDLSTFVSNIPRPAGSFGLQTSEFELVDVNGNLIARDAVDLHHVVLTTSARQDALCPGRPERFTGSGMERTKLQLWGPYAYLVGAGDQWGAILELVNMMPSTSLSGVYVQYKLGYQPGGTASNTRNVTPYFMDITGCATSQFNVPGNGGPGSVYTKTKSWVAPADGMAVFTGGHLHEGGIDISLKENNSGVVDCTGTAQYDGMGMITAINPCTLHDRVTKNNTYTVTARYDNSQAYAGVMGIMLTYVWLGTQ
jgi:hypothetical protein